MKILHTSDWHLGRTLYGRKRYDEFEAFLDWLLKTIENEKVDCLLVSGDIFDTTAPSNRAQELYYGFLCRTAGTCCRHVVIIAGNHDSPSFLNAPRKLLRAMNVYIAGSKFENAADEVITLHDSKDLPEGIICSVPYLRDRDIRSVEPGESVEDRDAKLIEGLKNHYAEVCRIAEMRRSEIERTNPGIKIPVIAMGHLFTAGGKTVDGDGVRELYIGSLAHVSREVFPQSIDYLALGHLHVPQRVGGAEHIRYSGSPIPMGFGEAGQEKKVVLVRWGLKMEDIHELAVPCFQPLERISGTLEEIQSRLAELKSEQSRAWLEIEYSGYEIIGNIRELLEEGVKGTSMDIRRIRNKRIFDQVLNSHGENETLDDLTVHEVFERCLDIHQVSPEDRVELVGTYREIIRDIQEEDRLAE